MLTIKIIPKANDEKVAAIKEDFKNYGPYIYFLLSLDNVKIQNVVLKIVHISKNTHKSINDYKNRVAAFTAGISLGKDD